MKLLLVIALVLSVHEFIAQKCTLEYCENLRCAQASVRITCPPGTYKESTETYNCSCACVVYQTEGQSCETQDCLPGLTCNGKKICESTNVQKCCDKGKCAGQESCRDGQVLMPSDPDKCRCCAVCVDKHGREFIAQECTPEYCDNLRCAQEVSMTCPPGKYQQSNGTYNCSNACVVYQIVGGSCETKVCHPGLKCNANKICESTNVQKYCATVKCAGQESCPNGQVLMPSDPDKCRCCAVCVDKHEIKNPKCKDGVKVE